MQLEDVVLEYDGFHSRSDRRVVDHDQGDHCGISNDGGGESHNRLWVFFFRNFLIEGCRDSVLVLL